MNSPNEDGSSTEPRGFDVVDSEPVVDMRSLEYVAKYDHLVTYGEFVCELVGMDGKPCKKLSERRYLEKSDKKEAFCPHIEYPCEKCEEMVSLVNQEWHLSQECTKNMVKCHGCNLEFPQKDFVKHEKYCQKIYVKCPGKKFGCSWRGSKEILQRIHLQECVFVKLSEYLTSQETKMDDLTGENNLLKSELSVLLDSVIQGRVTNLGFPLELEEVSCNLHGSENEILGGMEEDYAQLITDFERLRLNAQKAKRALGELEASKQMISKLATDNLQMKEELNSQRLVINSIRQQLQFMVLDRRRNGTEDEPKL
ncbi:hypothetical protein FOA43_002697 [Brettanomyces nanus]|uniref:TRAF-type domain-containing protein n=1 Tax=Eeniella nana TaxID=13502 RepID=A0A875S896_EENNA|nr:uncharacterized protein FOA43_002697 [Brettanomyces nanus]QPG75344.1 hypothetical protein FOA43_002697 [Brettanomyces nanus]